MAIYEQHCSDPLSLRTEITLSPIYFTGWAEADAHCQGATWRITFTVRDDDGRRKNVHPQYGPWIRISRGDLTILPNTRMERFDLGRYRYLWDTASLPPGSYVVAIETRTPNGIEIYREQLITLIQPKDAFRSPWKKDLRLKDSVGFETALAGETEP